MTKLMATNVRKLEHVFNYSSKIVSKPTKNVQNYPRHIPKVHNLLKAQYFAQNKQKNASFSHLARSQVKSLRS